MCFDFLYNFFSEKFLILKKNEQDMIKMYISLHVNYPLFLFDLNETWTLATDFRKLLMYHICWKSVHWDPSCSMRTGQTDRHEEAKSPFLQFSNAPKNAWTRLHRPFIWLSAVPKMATPSSRRDLKTCDHLIDSQLSDVMYCLYTHMTCMVTH